MIRDFEQEDFDGVLGIVNQAAEAYRGAIPADRWHEPYMSADDLEAEIAAGVAFRIYEADGCLAGVMGGQPVKDVFLIRHAYVAPEAQRGGIGGALLGDLVRGVSSPVLVGTWAAAIWAIDFYRRNGFVMEDGDETRRLLQTYWSIPERQIETSVVLRLIG